MNFSDITLDQLEASSQGDIDAAPFSIIGMSRDGLVQVYNEDERLKSGLPKTGVIGQHFFDTIAICMNNYLVAERYEQEAELDAVMDYVLTVRMRPTRVRLRMLQKTGFARRYLLIDRG